MQQREPIEVGLGKSNKSREAAMEETHSLLIPWRWVLACRWALSVCSWLHARLIGLLVVLISVYQRLLSPLLGGRCRFSPSCSEYTIESLKKHGLLRGGVRSTRRILRCNPLGGSGYDPP